MKNIILLSALLLAGCFPEYQPPHFKLYLTEWGRPGATEAEWKLENHNCRNEAEAKSNAYDRRFADAAAADDRSFAIGQYTGSLTGSRNIQYIGQAPLSAYDDCMMAHSWEIMRRTRSSRNTQAFIAAPPTDAPTPAKSSPP